MISSFVQEMKSKDRFARGTPSQAAVNRLAQFPDRNQKLTRAVNCTFLGSETVEVGTPKDESVGFVSGIANW